MSLLTALYGQEGVFKRIARIGLEVQEK